MNYKQQLEKVAFGSEPLVTNNYGEDKSDRTSFMRDRVMPGLKTKGYGMAGAMAGAAVGAGLGLAGKKATRAAYKKALSSDMSKRLGSSLGDAFQGSHELMAKGRKMGKLIEEPAKILFGPEMAKARSVAAAGVGAMSMMPTGKEVGKVVGNVNALNKQYVNQFGVEPSEKDIYRAAKLNPEKSKLHKSMADFFYTPNSMTKSEFREQQQVENLSNRVGGPNVVTDNYARDKQASDYVLEIEKMAMSLQDAKQGASLVGKALPYAGALAGAGLAAIPAGLATDSFTHDDDSKRKLKIGAATLGATALGGTLGGVIGKDIADVGRGIAKKVTDPAVAMKQIGGMASDGRFLAERALKAGKAFMTGK